MNEKGEATREVERVVAIVHRGAGQSRHVPRVLGDCLRGETRQVDALSLRATFCDAALYEEGGAKPSSRRVVAHQHLDDVDRKGVSFRMRTCGRIRRPAQGTVKAVGHECVSTRRV